MGRTGLFVAWLASCAPLALSSVLAGGAARFAGVSVLALAALPWVFWLGAPRTLELAPDVRAEAWPFAFALSPILAAAGADIAQGSSVGRALALAGAALALALVLACAARRAAQGPRSARVHAISWSVLVALPALAAFALEAGGAPFLGDPPAALAALARWSPLGWLAAHARDAAGPLAPPWMALGIAAATWIPVEIARDREGDA